jgi:hypothetical protein
MPVRSSIPIEGRGTDMEILLVPEEEIYQAIIQSFTETFPRLVKQCNADRGIQWIVPFASILDTGESSEFQSLPLVEASLKEAQRKSSNPFVDDCQYILTLSCRFERTAPSYMAYRYAYLLKRLFKEDEAFTAVVDRFLLEECLYKTLSPLDGMGYPEAVYKIRIYRDEVK